MGLSVLTQGYATCPEQCRGTLSKMLQVTMLNADAFNKAVECGYIVLSARQAQDKLSSAQACEGGLLNWTLGSKTLLAYFCGKLWSGDKGKYSCRKKAMVWQKGERSFPAAELERLFGLTTLKKLRMNRSNMVLPEHFEIVDLLFDSM